MYAILTGSNRDTIRHQQLLDKLTEIAESSGFSAPASDLRITPDQQSLNGWDLSLKGPQGEAADFFLAVTAPSVPGISPIPVQKTVEGAMFAVAVMDTFFGIRREDKRDYIECHSDDEVCEQFADFITTLKNRE